MTIQLQNLHRLDKHFEYLKSLTSHETLFFVGGSIRDLLLGVVDEPTDLDITTAGEPSAIFDSITKKDISIFKTDKFGTITLIPKPTPITAKLFGEMPGDLKYELTPLRLEGGYEDFRHPWEIQRTPELILDSNRRDFTINCLYYTSFSFSKKLNPGTQTSVSVTELTKNLVKDWFFIDAEARILILQNHELIEEFFSDWKLNTKKLSALIEKNGATSEGTWGVVVDPHLGIQDIVDRTLRAVWKPDKRFQEDALRIIRALRLVNILNDKLFQYGQHNFFDFETPTWRSLKKNYYLVQFLAKERIKDELVKVFKGNNPFGFIALLDETNILKYLFPQLHATKGVHQPVRYHPFDVFAHTLLVLYHLQQLNTNYLVKLGTLYHDVWKTDQYYVYTIGLQEEEARHIHGSWLNHSNSGSDMAQKDFSALWFSNKEVEEISWYVKMHMKPGEILDAKPENRPKKIRKMLSENWFDRVNNLFDICKADRLGQFNTLQAPSLHQVDELKEILTDLFDREGQFDLKALDINGNDLMTSLKLKPGPIVKELLDLALQRVSSDIAARNQKKTIVEYLKNIMKTRKKEEKSKK